MKNIFRFVMAVAVLFTASCTKEDISSSIVGGGEVEMTFTVDLPELGTRAYADGAKATTLRYYVYDGDNYLSGISSESLPNQKVTLTNGKAVVTLPLLKGMTYNIIFWADNGSDIYSIDPATKVLTVDYTGVMSNDDSRDAFYKYLTDVDPTDATKIKEQAKVILTRPFGQLNAATSDFEAVKNNGVTLTTSTLKAIKANNTLDLTTGLASNQVNITFAEAAIPTETLKAGYKYLSMNYLLPGTVDAEYTFKGKRSDNSVVKFTGTTYTNVPVKANYRTNILGKLLTASTEFTVTIEKDFFEPDKDIVQTAAELQQQINNAPVGEETEIVLGGDIDLNDLLGSLGTLSTRATATPSLTIAADKNIVLDLNGYTLSATEESTGSYGLITNKGTLTINDSKGSGKIELTATQNRGWNAYSSVISNNPGGVLIVNDGTIEHLGGTDMAYGIDNLTNGKGTSAVATINGGAVKSSYIGIRQFLNGIEATNSLTVKGGEIHGVKRSIWMQGPSANKNSGNLEVTAAAKLYGNAYISTAEGTADWDVSMSIAAAALQDGFTVAHGILPEGYSVVEENGVWTVTFTHIANIGEDGYNSIQDAVAAVEDGETIIVNRNATFNEGNRMSSGGTWYEGVYYIGDKSFTIDLNNNTISQNGAVNDYMFLFKNDGEKANTITFKNGTIDAGTAAYCALCTSTTSTQKITINLDNVNLIGNNSGGAVAKIRGGAELNVNADTVITGIDSYVGIEAFGNNTVVNINEGAKIYQNGTSSYVGSLAGASGGATINVYGGEGVSASGGFIVMTSGGTVNISGGNWTANTDGTYANSNKSVLISQSAKGAKCTVNVTGGTFKGGYNCYGDAVGDATINIYGGNFNANPSAYVVAGKAATENNGTWTIIDAVSTAEALAAALAQGGVVTLGADIALTETAVIAEGKSVVLNLNGKTLAAADKNTIRNDGGNLTIKNGTVTRTGDIVGYAVNNASGEIVVENVTITRGLYTSGSKLTATNANISHEQSSRHAIYAWNCEVTLNSGTYHNDNAGNATLMAAGSSVVVVNGGTFSIADGRSTLGWTSCVFDQKDTANVTIKGGRFNGGFRINSADTVLTVEGGEFNTNNGSGYSDYSGTVSIKGGTYTDDAAKTFAKKYVAEGYKVNANGEVVAGNYYDSEIVDWDGVRYEGDVFESGHMDNTLWLNNLIFGGDAAIRVVDKKYNAIVIENCSGSFKNHVITIANNNDSVMILENLDLTIAEGKKLITTANQYYQVFMANITINGVKMTQESIAQYLENVVWYQVVEEI